MKFFKNLKLGTKQITGFGIILLIMAGLNVYELSRMQAIQSEIDEVSRNWLPRAVAISDINRNISDLRIEQLQHAFTPVESAKIERAQAMIELIDAINANLDTYEKLKKESESRGLYSSQEERLFGTFDQSWETYQDLSFVFFSLINEKQRIQAVSLLNGEARAVFNSLSSALEGLVAVTKNRSTEAANRAETTFNNVKRNARILLVATSVLSLFLALGLVRMIAVPVQQLERAAGEVANGNLDVRLNFQSKDEIGSLAQSFNRMTGALKDAKTKMENQAARLKEKNDDLAHAMEELRTSQERLLVKEKMASLGGLVAGIAHEINSPIGSVSSSADVLTRCLEKIEEDLRDNGRSVKIENNQLSKTLRILRDNIGVTKVASDRIATIVSSLKNFARLDESHYQRADIHEGLDSSLTLLENELHGRVKIAKQYGEIPRINCYPGQLNYVFMNILKNACDAIDGSGQISIKTFLKGELIYVEISDTGRGIPKEKLDSLFNVGFTAGGSRIKFSSGLSTALNIIRTHSGRIKVKSAVGAGTTFSIVLPIVASSA